MTRDWLQRSLPYFILLSLMSCVLVISLLYPLETLSEWIDPSLQLKSIQQYITGVSPSLNTVVLPDPQDLSQSIFYWIVWYPPGLPVLLYPLIAAGIPLGTAIRLTTFCFIGVGGLGWIQVARYIKATPLVVTLTAAIVPFYYFRLGLIYIGDSLPFGIMPWLFLGVLYLTDHIITESRSKITILLWILLVTVGLGTIYWIKYSAFVISVSLMIYFYIILFLDPFRAVSLKWIDRFLVGFVGSLSFCIPYGLLKIVNQSLSSVGDLLDKSSQSSLTDPATRFLTTYGFGLFISAFGVIGASFSQSVYWLWSLTDQLFYAGFLRFGFEREIAGATLAYPITFLVLFILVRKQQFFQRRVVLLGLTMLLIPWGLFLFLSYLVGFNFFAYSRYFAPSMAFIQIIVLANLVQEIKPLSQTLTSNIQTKLQQIGWIGLLVWLFIIPNLYLLATFVQTVISYQQNPYSPTQNQLVLPNLAKSDLKATVETIHSVIDPVRDVVVLAASPFTSYGEILEIQSRVIPLSEFQDYLQPVYGSAISPADDTPFLTSADLNVAVVINQDAFETYSAFETKLMERFPQARRWRPVTISLSEGRPADVAIWVAELEGSQP